MIKDNRHKNYRKKIWNMDKPKEPGEPLAEDAGPGKYNHLVLDTNGNLIEHSVRKHS